MESVDPQKSIACCGLSDGPRALVTARDGRLQIEREPGHGATMQTEHHDVLNLSLDNVARRAI